MSKPTFVIIHGAWHTPAHFGPLISSLESHGYRVLAPALPSVSESESETAAAQDDSTRDIETVRDVILAELDSEGNDVIVVPHSYGGIVAMGAVEGLDRESRVREWETRQRQQQQQQQQQGTELPSGEIPAVTAIAAITAYVLPKGMTIHDIELRPNTPNTPPIFPPLPNSKDLFYHDLGSDLDSDSEQERERETEKEKWTSLLRPISSAALWDASRFDAHEVLPVHYLLATADRAVPLETQLRIVDALRGAGTTTDTTTGTGTGTQATTTPTSQSQHVVRTETLEGAGHSPYLSRVRETRDFLRRSAGEDV